MGRDQELRDAARTGNISVIDKILSQRPKPRGGALGFAAAGLASLRRSANPNCQDLNGDTPLHHAALNGHNDAVAMLLQYEASANIVDNKGCYPLHLASFNGHSQICTTLLTHGPSVAQINQQNNEGETALHCACQYGLTQVVNVLLEHLADPTVRNLQNESALDLAAKYGRLETVQLLLRKHPGLLDSVADDCSALHLAARHGHKQVVQVLIDAGFDVNRKTDKGSALHEAAFYGKTDVVRLLLENGIDISLTDRGNNTALDLVSELKSQRALDIGRVILGFLEGKPPPKTESTTSSDLIRLSSCSDQGDALGQLPRLSHTPDSLTSSHSQRDSFASVSSNHSGIYSLGGRVPSERGTPVSHGSRESVTSAGSSVFDPGQRHSGGSIPDGELEPIYDTPCRPASFGKGGKRTSHGSDFSESPGNSPRNSTALSVSPKPQVKPGETPKKPPRRKPPSAAVKMVKEEEAKLASLNNGNHGDSIQTSPHSGALSKRLSLSAEDNHSDRKNTSMVRRKSTNDVDLTPRPSSTPASLCDKENDNMTDLITAETSTNVMSASTIENNNDISKMDNEKFHLETNVQDQSESTSSVKDTSISSSTPLDRSSTSDRSSCPDAILSTSSSRPPSLELGSSSQRSSKEVPLSPSGYEQPPTPDHPPPSPMTAVLGIQEKINPLEKRRSRDMETITEAEYLSSESGSSSTLQKQPTNPPSSNTDRSSIIRHSRRRNEAASFTNGHSPFVGLMKGSLPSGQRRIKSQIYDSVLHLGSKSKKRISAPGLPPNFDALMEKEEKPPDASEIKSGVLRPRSEVKDKRLSAELRKSLVKEATTRGSVLREDGTGSPLVDETAEWEKISAILSSCGGRMSVADFSDNEYFEKRLQELFAQDKEVHSVGDWLEELGLLQYENILIANGFDDIDFLGPDILEEQDLVEMGVMSEQHRRALLTSCDKLPQLKTIDDHPPESVEQWLAALRLSVYHETFLARNYNSMDRVRKLWDPELSTVLDISSVGHRKRILASLGSHQDGDSSSSHGDEFQDFTKTLQSWSHTDTDGATENYNDLNLFKDYSNIKPRPQHATEEGEEDFDLRPPQVSTESPIKQWRHAPEVLIKGCCNYTAQYLGSTLVSNLQGTESTREAIQKMKKSTEAIGKVPAIILSISYHGVKFIDAKNKSGVQHVICEHEISNIFCACQDGDDLNYFAYITRDLQADSHYCHVFAVKSTDLATEVILTLGEAFEVAYQVAMREQAFLNLDEAAAAVDLDRAPLPTLSESSPELENAVLPQEGGASVDTPNRLTSTPC